MQRSFSLDALSDKELLVDTERLAERWCAVDAELTAHIAEVERRGLFRDEGFPSMYAYVTEALGLSESAAYRRIRAARLAWNHPAIFQHLATGELTVSTVCELAAHRDELDIDELIEDSRGRSKREVQTMLADRGPLRHVPTKTRPLGAERYALEMTVSAEFQAKLETARELTSHAEPAGDIEAILERALDALIDKESKRRNAKTDSPRAARPANDQSRRAPAAVRREVAARDGGQCVFVSESGRRCTSRLFIELDHIDPYCRGGAASADGIRQLCSAHNQLVAEQKLGEQFMRDKRHSRRS